MAYEGLQPVRDSREEKPSHEGVAQYLIEAYRLIYKKYPDGMQAWQIAGSIIEALDDPAVISNDLAKECIFEITNGRIVWPDDVTRIDIVTFAEEAARVVFPELAHSDEVHMAEIEYVYNEWKHGGRQN